MNRLDQVLLRYRRLLLVLVVMAALLQAWTHRFVQDDAFISFCYARDLVENGSLTWFGTPVEGYSNFLWVLWTAAGLTIGMEPVLWSQLGGIAAFLLMLMAFTRLAWLLLGSPGRVGLALLLLLGNYSVVSYATGGLETMLQTCLLCWLALVHLQDRNRPSQGNQLAFSLLAGAAILTRLDSALPVAVLGLARLRELQRRDAPPGAYLLLLGPGALMLGGWTGWKLSYYGRLLPNPFYAKVGTDTARSGAGLLLAGRFLHWYLLWPFLLVGALAAGLQRRVPDRSTRLLLSLIVPWLGYLAWVGGDFMEFRFLIPISPFLMLFLTRSILRIGQALSRPLLTAGIALAVLLGASWHHGATFRGMTPDGLMDSIPALASFHEMYPDGDWSRLGLRLRQLMPDDRVILATRAAGAIPYYSRFSTVDQWGLNDPRIPLEGIPAAAEYRRPGHRMHSSLAYLKERGVNLVLGHPTLVIRGCVSNPAATEFLADWVRSHCLVGELPEEPVHLVALPVSPQAALLVWYLTPAPDLDTAIQAGGWEHTWVDVGAPS